MSYNFELLESVLEQRKQADPEKSYVAQLHSKGLNKVLEKVGEECTEAILAAKDHDLAPSNNSKSALIGEVADLWFHTLVMLSHLELSQCDIMQELERRFGQSGLDEKASRGEKG